MAGPFLSVIVPVHQGTAVLPRSLDALLASELPREYWELVVVDDASTDESSVIAARYADTVIRIAGKPRGPAYARNRGCEASRGEVLVFVDADVCVHPETLSRFAALFARHADVGAAFGSYDLEPSVPTLVSQYRNLLHAYVHHQHPGEAETFWAGCGAIRRSAFLEVGMFDEWHYPRPQIEDIELGRRLRGAGHRILLRPEIQCTHLKEWTLFNMLSTDLSSRGVPWLWLLLEEGADVSPLNVRPIEKICTALIGLSLVAAVVAIVLGSALPLSVSAAAISAVLFVNRGFLRVLYHRGGLRLALAGIPLHVGFYIVNGLSVVGGWLMHQLFGEPQPPPDVEAQAAIGVSTWPPTPALPRRSIWGGRREAPAAAAEPGDDASKEAADLTHATSEIVDR
jgi:hypothetical protein